MINTRFFYSVRFLIFAWLVVLLFSCQNKNTDLSNFQQQTIIQFNAATQNNLLEAFALAKNIREMEDQKNILGLLVNLHYEKESDTIKYFKQYTSLADTIFNNKYLTEIAQAEIRYATKLKEAEIKLLKSKNTQKKYQNLLLFLMAVVVIIVALWILTVYNKRIHKLQKRKKLEDEKHKNQELIQQRTELNLTLKHQQLIAKSLTIAKYQNSLNILSEELLPYGKKLRGVKDQKTFTDILLVYKSQIFVNPLEEFETAFKAIHPNFYKNILQQYPKLTPREIHICALIRLNLQTKQIAFITSITSRSLETARYRIRVKMGLSTHQNLTNRLKSL